MSDIKELGKTSVGLQANMAGLLCYLFGWVSGLIFFLIEKENKFVKFHALQSIIVFAVLSLTMIILPFIPILGWIAMLILPILSFVLWIVLMVKAYQGECFKVPVAGDFAEKKTKP
ncbi:DUF4870 domain-containing protein [Candidatus Omnitrophota bacterium]